MYVSVSGAECLSLLFDLIYWLSAIVAVAHIYTSTSALTCEQKILVPLYFNVLAKWSVP